MRIPPMSVPHEYHHSHAEPENAPHGWGVAFSHFSRKYNDLPGQLDEKHIPSNVGFWTAEVEKLEKELHIATEGNKVKLMEQLFNKISVAKYRLSKESE